MKIKTSELTGAALDWAVAKCEGDASFGWTAWGTKQTALLCIDETWRNFKPSTDWAQGGPIIYREKIGTAYARGCWMAHPDRANYPDCNTPYFFGETPLIAAMRCYVVSKLGDEVDVPEELTP